MNTHLILRDHEGRMTDLTAFPVVLGRADDADLQLTNIMASRYHCEISADETGFIVRDLNAMNGTLVNGQPVETHRLRPGDQLTVGASVFDVLMVPEVIQPRRRSMIGRLRKLINHRPRSVERAGAKNEGSQLDF